MMMIIIIIIIIINDIFNIPLLSVKRAITCS